MAARGRWLQSAFCVFSLANAAGCASQDDDLILDETVLAAASTEPGFYFYPPFGPLPTATRVFEPRALEHVQIDIDQIVPLTGTVLRHVRTFTHQTTPRIFQHPQAETFSLGWPVQEDNLIDNATYRVRASAEGIELGYSDIDPRYVSHLRTKSMLWMQFRVDTHAVDRDQDQVFDWEDHCPAIADSSNPVPAPESCDGRDNDCDGQSDEDNPGSGVACSTGLRGVCASGLTLCANSQLLCVQASLPGVEWCDGLDNDCDGSTDESCTSQNIACSAVRAAQSTPLSGVFPIDLDGTGPLPTFNAYCNNTTDGGGWTLVMRVQGGLHAAIGEVSVSLLSGRNTHAKLADSTIRTVARAGAREAMITNGTTTYILRYSDAEWAAFASNGWQNTRYDSKRSNGTWANDICNGHWNNRGFSTWNDSPYQACSTVYQGPAAYLASYHVLYANVGGNYEVYVR